jgi:hypothetical protein
LSEAYNESDVAPHDGGRNSFGERIRIAPEEARSDERLRWTRSNNRSAIERRSIGKRMLYATTRFVMAVLIGVAATLGWQAYGDEGRTRLASWDPSLAWLTPPPAAQPSPVVAAVSSADLAQQIKPITLEIAAIRQNVEQLAAKQEQFATDEGRMAQGLAVIHALEQDIGLKVSSLAQPKPVHAQPPRQPAQRPAQPLELPEQRH